MAKTIGSKLEPFLETVVPLLNNLMKQIDNEKSVDVDNELFEACLITLEAMFKNMPNEMAKYLDVTLKASLELLQYDPNFMYIDEDEEMEDEEEENEDWGSDFDDDE
jgi:hypothetical protein